MSQPRHNSKAATKPKKLPTAAVEATALAFVAGFKALPGAVQWRVVQLIEEYEDELAEVHDAAEMAANPEEYSRENAVPWEQVKAELANRDRKADLASSKSVL